MTFRLPFRRNALKSPSLRSPFNAFVLNSYVHIYDVARGLTDNAFFLGENSMYGSGFYFLDPYSGNHDYAGTLDEIRKTGYARYWMREFRPYFTGALRQFSPRHPSLTERLLKKRIEPPMNADERR